MSHQWFDAREAGPNSRDLPLLVFVSSMGSISVQTINPGDGVVRAIPLPPFDDTEPQGHSD